MANSTAPTSARHSSSTTDELRGDVGANRLAIVAVIGDVAALPAQLLLAAQARTCGPVDNRHHCLCVTGHPERTFARRRPSLQPCPTIVAAICSKQLRLHPGRYREAHIDAPGPSVGAVYHLGVPDLAASSPFDQTLRRRSTRVLLPPTLEQLGAVVARAGLDRAGTHTERGVTVLSRPTPSAGALHPLELVVLLSAAASNPLRAYSRSWVLDPAAAVLRPGVYKPEAIDAAIEAIADAMRVQQAPPAAIMAVACPQRTLSRYPARMSLLWRETGALMMLLHLAATDLGLGSCLVGTCAVLHSIGDSSCAPVDLGAVAIGVTGSMLSSADHR